MHVCAPQCTALLQVGNGPLTIAEQRAHFALWALLKSTMMIGTDLRSISPDSLGVLKSNEVLAVSQDPLGVPGDLIWKQGPKEVRSAVRERMGMEGTPDLPQEQSSVAEWLRFIKCASEQHIAF